MSLCIICSSLTYSLKYSSTTAREYSIVFHNREATYFSPQHIWGLTHEQSLLPEQNHLAVCHNVQLPSVSSIHAFSPSIQSRDNVFVILVSLKRTRSNVHKIRHQDLLLSQTKNIVYLLPHIHQPRLSLSFYSWKPIKRMIFQKWKHFVHWWWHDISIAVHKIWYQLTNLPSSLQACLWCFCLVLPAGWKWFSENSSS